MSDRADVDLTIEAQQVPVNMYETTEALVVVAPMPGVMPEDVQVTFTDGCLRLRADMRTTAVKDYLVHEWHYGPFERTIELPRGFGGDIHASFGNGQLAVRVGKGDALGSGEVTVTPEK